MPLTETRFGGNATGLPVTLLPSPRLLPSLSSAFSRRRAIFGVLTLAASPMAALPAMADVPRAGETPADIDLIDLADELCTTLDGAAYAMDPVYDEDDQRARLRHADALILRIVEIPDVSPAGIKAKGKAYLDSASYDVMNGCELATSLAEDAERLNGGAGVLAAS